MYLKLLNNIINFMRMNLNNYKYLINIIQTLLSFKYSPSYSNLPSSSYSFPFPFLFPFKYSPSNPK